ncbi:sensor histidine kinase [Paenibacillus aceti]|nr:histidine kinase [Paenibacillus aceti]
MRNQLTLLMFILLPLSIVSFTAFFLIKDVVIDKVQSSRQNVVDVMAGDMEKSVEDIIYASNLFRFNALYDDLQVFKNVDQIDSSEDYKRYERISDMLNLAFSKTSGLKALVFYVNKAQFQIGTAGADYEANHRIEAVTSKWMTEQWKRETDPERIYWFNVPVKKGDLYDIDESTYLFVKVIKEHNGNDYLGVLYVAVSHRYFYQLFEGIGAGQIGLYEADGTPILLYPQQSELESVPGVIELQSDISKTGWKVGYRFSPKEIMDEITNIFFLYGLVLGVSILIFITLSIVLAKRIHRPLFKLRRIAEQFGSGNRLVRFPAKGSDEFGVLGSAFNNMLDQINQLIADVEQEQEEKRIIELQALFSQIRPHFLINTLNSIKCDLLLAGDSIRGRQVEALMSLLRAYMRVNDKSTLSQECKLLQDYIDIMKVRSRLRLYLIVELPEHLESFEVPRLILQPLVENAIVHGFANPPDYAEIEVQISETESGVIIEVKDNGIGMEEGQIDRLRSILRGEVQVEENRRVGLLNTLRRLRLTYGPDATMDMLRNEEAGTTFIMFIPKLEESSRPKDQAGYIVVDEDICSG